MLVPDLDLAQDRVFVDADVRVDLMPGAGEVRCILVGGCRVDGLEVDAGGKVTSVSFEVWDPGGKTESDVEEVGQYEGVDRVGVALDGTVVAEEDAEL